MASHHPALLQIDAVNMGLFCGIQDIVNTEIDAQESLEVFMKAALIILFGLLQIADGIVTYLGLNFFGLEEANPILNYFAGLIGLVYSMALLKLAGLSLIAILFLGRRKIKNHWFTAGVASAVVLYSWVVTNNVLLIVPFL
jgi:hypothetical protein